MISHYIGNCSRNNLPLRHTLMTLLPYKALTTLICFQKPLRLHIGELVHTKTPEDESDLHQLQSHVFVNLNEYDDF